MTSQKDSNHVLIAVNNWHDPTLENNNVKKEEVLPSNRCVSCMKMLFQIIFGIIFVPIILVIFIVFLLLWILPGFGYCYEKYAEKRDRKKYAPPSDNLKPWGPNGEMVHVIHINGGNEADKTVPPIFYVNGLSASMCVAEKLIKELAKNFGKPIEIVSVDSPGYGFSQAPKSWENESPETELILMQNVIKGLNLRKPYILFGASAGATLSQLYRLRYPEEVCACILYDPTPSNAIREDSPLRSEYSKAFDVYKKMSTCASIGIMRPMVPIIKSLPGELSDAIRALPEAHLPIFMTSTMLLKTGNHFRYWLLIMKEAEILANEYQNNPEKKNSNTGQKILNMPLLVVGGLAWKHAHGNMTTSQMNAWWRENQQPFVKTSYNSSYVGRTDYDHVECMLDMKLAANCVKSILTHVNN